MIYKVVLTGGPCGGKSTALPELAQQFTKNGFKVFTIPEIATLLYSNGVLLKVERSVEYHYTLEQTAFRLQVAMEENLVNIANTYTENSVIIHDRGLMDLKAYCPPEMWKKLVLAENRSERFLLENHYDLVLHLVTAADGAEAFFTNENNPARQCDPARARWLDNRSLQAWDGHPNRIRIDNSTDFQGKLDRASAAIEKLLSPRVYPDTKCPYCHKQGNLKACETEYACWDCGVSYVARSG